MPADGEAGREAAIRAGVKEHLSSFYSCLSVCLQCLSEEEVAACCRSSGSSALTLGLGISGSHRRWSGAFTNTVRQAEEEMEDARSEAKHRMQVSPFRICIGQTEVIRAILSGRSSVFGRGGG